MRKMRGPWSFVSQEWGRVVEGFSSAPVVLSPYNPPYYNDLLVWFSTIFRISLLFLHKNDDVLMGNGTLFCKASHKSSIESRQ